MNIKIAWRSLFKNKATSIINIGGLAVGMAVAMLIGLWIWDEVSYNKNFQNYSSIAQVTVNADYDGQLYTINSNPLPMANELRTVYGSNFKYVVASTGSEQHTIINGDKAFNQNGRYMQAEAPEMLTLKMLNGSQKALHNQSAIMLSASLAEKIFGNADPIGKLLKIDNKQNVTVAGVYQDIPQNSEFKDLAFIASFDLYLTANPWAGKAQNDWNNQFVQIYTQVNAAGNFDDISNKIKFIKRPHLGGTQAKRKPVVFLQPMSKWHLYSKFENGVNVQSDELKYVWFYGIIGAFVLLLACINFMNLSTARSEKRAKEVGIRKVMGSRRGLLIRQFFAESLLVVAFSFVVSLVLVQLSLPWFNGVAAKEMVIPFANPVFWCASGLFILITGLLAGSYPALYLSSFNPVKVIKGTFKTGRYAATPRKALVVLQFTVSVALIIGTIVVYRQIQFAQSRPVGYSREGLVSVQITSPDFHTKYDVLKNELKGTGAATETAESSSPVTSIWSTSTDFDWAGKAPATKIWQNHRLAIFRRPRFCRLIGKRYQRFCDE